MSNNTANAETTEHSEGVTEDVYDRLERATTEPLSAYRVKDDPIVVLVYNDSSDRMHTVIPSAARCSCEDALYRNTVCKHLLYVLIDEDDEVLPAQQALVGALDDYANDLDEEITELEDRLSDAREARVAVEKAQNVYEDIERDGRRSGRPDDLQEMLTDLTTV